MATLTKKRRALLTYIRLSEEDEKAIAVLISGMKQDHEVYYRNHPNAGRIGKEKYEELVLQLRLTTLLGKGLL